jgi:peptidase E
LSSIKPIFLLADSQLLFWREESGEPFLARARRMIDDDLPAEEPKAAYLGASNGDAPEFYELFVAAMAEIGIRDTRMIPSRPESEDWAYLRSAHLILLAGGDVELGWKAFEAAGLPAKLLERYYAGAVLIGVSAGAVQLGLKGFREDGSQGLFDTFKAVPFVVDAHDEPSWSRLLYAVPRAGEHARGFGVPAGGGALYHPDYSVEPIRHPLVEVSLGEDGVRQALLFPGETAEVEPPAGPSPETAALLEELRPEADAAPEDSEAPGAASPEDGTGDEPVN